MRRKAWLIGQVWRHFGLSWLVFRARYALRKRSGALKQALPVMTWEQLPLAGFLTDSALAAPENYHTFRRQQGPRFCFQPDQVARYRSEFAEWDQIHPNPVDLAEEIMAGTLRYFNHTPQLVGNPPDWHLNPFTGQRAAADQHWSEIDEYASGDIKLIWEASRFGFTYPLVRAYARTGDDHYAELFWQWLDDWRCQNPPQRGPNWQCGQETSFRVMAWCFGLYGFLNAAATTPDRVQRLAQMIAVSGQRIAANLDYALSQRNNHGISEALGLWTIGTLFPEFKPATHWQALGRHALEAQARDLIDDDGAFTQHSVNYHRVLLHNYLWALRLAEVNGLTFDPTVKERLGRATDWLYQLQDAASGQVPYYGQNDGALTLPLSNCDYHDFRPVIQAANYLLQRTRRFEPGPWDEDLLWLAGTEALTAPVAATPRTDLQANVGGYYTLRSPQSFVFVRGPTYRSRPGQADALHTDVWWHGQNVALDAGTYTYNAPAPWNNPLAHTEYHNTISVDGRDQMERAGRFLWLPWLHSRVRPTSRSAQGDIAYWEGEHDGYQRLSSPVRHCRAIVQLGDEHWLILDRLLSGAVHQYRLHWLLADWSYDWSEVGELTMHSPDGPYRITVGASVMQRQYSIVRADALSERGWRAPYYYYREPGVSLALIVDADATWFWTVLGPSPYQFAADSLRLQINTGQWLGTLDLNDSPAATLVNRVSLSGMTVDQLEL